MLQNFLTYLVNSRFKKIIWQKWYNLLTSKLTDNRVTFMNYGYMDLSPDIKLLELNHDDQKEIYCAQLYDHVANAVPLKGLDVLEVGCGRGGGSSYIKRYLQPKTMTGVDFSKKNIAFCQKHHLIPELTFRIGDAELLPFEDRLFDIVINVESSHCYAAIEKFFAEVFRVIRPEGYFLFADFREKKVLDDIKKSLESSGFKFLKSEIITQNVLKAMHLDNERKLSIINQNISKYFQTLATWFSGCKNTPIYQSFENGELEYFCYVLQKPSI